MSCNFVLKGETAETLAKQALEHVREQHSADFNLINSPEQVDKMEQALVRSMRVVAG